MSEIYSEEDMLSLENDFEVQLQNMADLDGQQQRVLASREVDRLTMEGLHQKYPEVKDEEYPLGSFTKEPTDQNLAVSLESFGIAKAIATAAAGAILGSILFMFVKLFRTDNAEQRAKNVEEKAREKDKGDATISEMIKEAKGLQLSNDDQRLVRAIEDNNHLEYLTSPVKGKASSQGKIFMDGVSPGGDVFRLFSKWSRSIHNHYTSFSARVAELTKLIDKMYEVDAKNVDKFVEDVKKVMLDPDDEFFKEMGELHDTFQSFLQRTSGDFKAFLNENVFDTREFYDFALMDDQWSKNVEKISPNGGKGLEKNLDRLEADAQALVDGKKEAAYKAKRSKSQARVDENGNVEMDAVVSNIAVERAIKDAEFAIRSEVQHLRVYRINLNRVLYFYQMTALKALEANTERSRLLREIINRSQPNG